MIITTLNAPVIVDFFGRIIFTDEEEEKIRKVIEVFFLSEKDCRANLIKALISKGLEDYYEMAKQKEKNDREEME